MTVLYRYEDVTYAAPVDEYERSIGSSQIEVCLREYTVVRKTAKGCWISLYGYYPHAERFVLASARKRFAHPTIEEARASFIARKRRQISIYQARIDQAKRALAALGLRPADGMGSYLL